MCGLSRLRTASGNFLESFINTELKQSGQHRVTSLLRQILHPRIQLTSDTIDLTGKELKLLDAKQTLD
jgi:hypothetical protein